MNSGPFKPSLKVLTHWSYNYFVDTLEFFFTFFFFIYYLFNDLVYYNFTKQQDVKPNEDLICQQYVAKPFLIDGFKFDLRIYVLVTSCDPLRVFVYNDGLARFSTVNYEEPSNVNVVSCFFICNFIE